jgi:hypothetical protein
VHSPHRDAKQPPIAIHKVTDPSAPETPLILEIDMSQFPMSIKITNAKAESRELVGRLNDSVRNAKKKCPPESWSDLEKVASRVADLAIAIESKPVPDSSMRSFVNYIYELAPEHHDKEPYDILMLCHTYIMLNVTDWLVSRGLFLNIHSRHHYIELSERQGLQISYYSPYFSDSKDLGRISCDAYFPKNKSKDSYHGIM